MSDKVALNLKVSAHAKSLLALCAAMEYRTISAYVEAFVVLDAKAKMLTEVDVPKDVPKKAKKEVKDVKSIKLPDSVDPLLFDDWLQHRKEMKRAVTSSSLGYLVTKMERAIANGWDVNKLLSQSIENGWQGFIFDNHLNEQPNGKVVVQSAMTNEDIKARIEKLLKMDCLYVADQSVWADFFAMAFTNNQCLEVQDVANICKVFRKLHGNKYSSMSDDRLQQAMESKQVLDSEGELVMFTRDELSKSGL